MKAAATEIIYLPIGEIKAYEKNPRDNEKAVEPVMRSMKRYGVRSPAIIDKDNVLLAGHTRLKAAIRLGMKEFPCVRADDLSKNQGKAFRLADNRMQEDSTWDTEALAQEFAALKENGFDLLDTGFDEFELAGITFNPEDIDGEDYDTPAAESAELEEWDEPSEPQGGETFVCIFCLKDESEKAMLAEIIGETGDLHQRYTAAEVRKMLAKGEADDPEDD